jgi:hypothetical protein
VSDFSGTIFDLGEEARQQQRGVVQQEEGMRVLDYDAPRLVPMLSAQGLLSYAWRPSAENIFISPESSEVSNDEFSGKDQWSGKPCWRNQVGIGTTTKKSLARFRRNPVGYRWNHC